ncbi:MAG: hypothetical protein OXU20_25660 [Myxococcales bacterium]|nr:hypothetical protein [Myxococcales bacterium]MDD9964737.1 hypothetical protein [Myxococcales bacterium]
MSALHGRGVGFWGPVGLAAAALGFAAAWLAVPHKGGAQAASAQEQATSELALAEHEEALAAVLAQVEAIPDLPGQVNGMVNQLTALIRAERRAVSRGQLAQGRDQGAKVAGQLKRIGRLIQRHLAPPPEDQAIGAEKARKRYQRIDARAKQMLAWAAEHNVAVDGDGLTAAAQAAEAAFQSGDKQQAKQAAKAYLAEVEAFELALEAAR